MFSAIVLLCTTDLRNINDCISAMSIDMFTTEQNCVMSLYEDYEAGIFTITTPDGKIATLKDFYCIDWSKEKI